MNRFSNFLREGRTHRKFIRRRINDLSVNQEQLDILRALRFQRRVFYCSFGFVSMFGSVNMYLFWDDLFVYITPKVTEPIINVSQDILANKDLQRSTQMVAQKIVCDLLRKQQTLELLTHLLCKLLKEEFVLEATNELVLKVLKDPFIQTEFYKVVGYALTDEYNQELLYDLLKKVLENSELRHKARETVLEVIEDHSLQEVSSNALWSVLKGAVTPTWGNSQEQTLSVQKVHLNVPVSTDGRIPDFK